MGLLQNVSFATGPFVMEIIKNFALCVVYNFLLTVGKNCV